MAAEYDRLFVYGTLRRGSGHRMQEVLAASGTWIGQATIIGRLFLVARYPGVTESTDPGDRVLGDVFQLRDPAGLLRKLDRYEGCNPGDPSAPYVRVQRPVTLTTGETAQAWVYLYNRSVTACERIASGDFFARRIRHQPPDPVSRG